MSAKMPELASLINAAREIVITARCQDNLESLTAKTVRRQVERDFALEEGTLDERSTKTALRNAIDAALSEELKDKRAKKRKISSEDSSAQENIKSKMIKEPKVNSSVEEGSGSSVKKRRKLLAVKSKGIIITDSEDNEDASMQGTTRAFSTSKAKQEINGPPAQSANAGQYDDAENTGSELSVLINEPPRKKRTKSNIKESTKKTTNRRSQKKKALENTLNSDQETVKRLKSFVTACGVRKVWSKEFADFPLPAQQITRLKGILSDLGMTGRYSLEKAKAIKKKRDLARELNDVVEFERKAGVSRGDRSRHNANAKRIIAELDTNSEVSASEHEDPVGEKMNTASKSIMAYLANQSSDDE